jgi:WD40 repeat protein
MPQNPTQRVLNLVAYLAICLVIPRLARAQEELHTFKNSAWVSKVAFCSSPENPDVSRILLSAGGDGAICAWDLESGQRSFQTKAHEDVVSALAPNTDGSVLITGSYDGTCRVWSWKRSEPHARPLVLHTPRGHLGAVTSAVFPGWPRAFATGSIDGTVKVWSPVDGRELATLRGHRSWVNSLDFKDYAEIHERSDELAKGKHLLASGSSDGTIKLWRLSMIDSKATTQPAMLARTLDVSNTEVRSLSLSPGAELVAAGLRYGDVQLWDTITGERKRSFKAHDGECWAVRFSPAGETLITGGGDWGKPGEVKLWDVKTGELRATLKHTGEVLCLAVSTDGRRIAAGAGDKTVKVWDSSKLLARPRK